jgi:hypothetical protein
MAAQYRLGVDSCQRRCRRSNAGALRAIPRSVIRAVLPIGAVLVLGLGVYLLVEVRAQPAPLAPATGRATPAPVPVAPPAAETPDEPARVTRATPPPPAAPATARVAAPALASAPPPSEPALVGPKLEAAMAEANKAYDRGELEDAKQLAGRLLAQDPTNVRMLRIMVSASCLDGDSTVAQAHYARLPAGDQEQMKVRCARYGITFPDKP